MKISRASLSEFLFRVEWVLVCTYFLLHPTLYNTSLTGLIWKTGFITFSLRTLLNIKQIKRTHTTPLVVIILIILFQCVTSGIWSSLDTVFSVSAFFVFLLHISNCEKHIVPRKRFDLVFYSSLFLALLFSVYSLTDLVHKVTTNGQVWYTTYFVFNLDNSNTAGMYLVFVFSILLINYPLRRQKTLLILVLIYLAYMIFRTNARMAILSCLFIFFAFLLFRTKRLPQWVINAVVLLPSLFVSFYLGLYRSGFEDLVILGKNLFSGRQNVYADYLKHIQTIPQILFGNLEEITFSNAHNATLAIYCSIGAVGVICFYYIVWGQLRKANYNVKHQINTIAICCIMGIFLQACSEATMFLGGFPGVAFISTLFDFAFSAEMHSQEQCRKQKVDDPPHLHRKPLLPGRLPGTGQVL